MLIEIDDDYVQWIKLQNPALFVPGQEKKAALAQYINEVLASHRQSWTSEEE